MRFPLASLLSVAIAVAALLAQAGRAAAEDAPGPAPSGDVVVYTALDREFSEPILKDFEAKTGIHVRPVYDTEAVKTVGLVNRLLSERARPVCDVFWNNEIVRSIQLKREGLTAPYRSPSAATIPDSFKDPEGHWTGFAARGRVILVNTKALPDKAAWPTHVADLADPKWKGRAAFAKPLFGTTSTHAAVLWARNGAEEATAFWKTAREQAVMAAGNAQARDAAADGEVAWCLTDTDDAAGALEDGKPVAIVYPDSEPGGVGMLLIPNTLVLVKGAPHPEAGKALIDYLLSEEVEVRLSKLRGAQLPVRRHLSAPPALPSLEGRGVMDVDWDKAADALLPSQSAIVPIVGQ